MKTIFSLKRSLGLAAACLLAFGGTTHAQNGEWMGNQNALNHWSRFSYVDFATVGGHVPHPTGTFGGVAGLRYKFLQLDGGSSINGAQCFEVSTSAPRFLPGTISDTRIWVTSHLGSPTPIGLNDDINGTRFSAARVWLSGAPSSFVNLAIAAYNVQDWNTIHFDLRVTQIPTTEANCTTAQALPWIKVKNGTMTKSANAF